MLIYIQQLRFRLCNTHGLLCAVATRRLTPSLIHLPFTVNLLQGPEFTLLSASGYIHTIPSAVHPARTSSIIRRRYANVRKRLLLT